MDISRLIPACGDVTYPHIINLNKWTERDMVDLIINSSTESEACGAEPGFPYLLMVLHKSFCSAVYRPSLCVSFLMTNLC